LWKSGHDAAAAQIWQRLIENNAPGPNVSSAIGALILTGLANDDHWRIAQAFPLEHADPVLQIALLHHNPDSVLPRLTKLMENDRIQSMKIQIIRLFKKR